MTLSKHGSTEIMADLYKHHEGMLRRHRSALVKFAQISKLAPEKLAFVIADSNSRMGLALKSSGVIITERASVVMPTTMDSIPALLAAAGASEVEQVVAAGGVPVVCIDEHDVASMSWEPLLPCVGRRREEPVHYPEGSSPGGGV